MDSLDVRLQFINHIKTLTRVTSSSPVDTALQFYLRHQSHYHEDLLQCLLDTLNKLDILERPPVLQLFTAIMKSLQDRQELQKNSSLASHLPNIISLVIPKNNTISLSNLSACETLLLELTDTCPDPSILESCNNIIKDKRSERSNIIKQFEENGCLDIDDTPVEMILRRIERDREQHKHGKQLAWHTSSNEFESLWSSSSSCGDVVVGCNNVSPHISRVDRAACKFAIYSFLLQQRELRT